MNTQSIISPNIDYGKISADKYSPDDTYEAGELRIQYNTLWKAKQAISVPEPWTPDHWDPTTLAAEFSALNSRIPYSEIFSTTISSLPAGQNTYFTISVDIPEGFAIGAVTLWCGDGSSGRIPALYSTPGRTLYGFVRNESGVGSNIPVYAQCVFVSAKS